MKLSRREKVLIIVLIISIIVFAGYKVIPSVNLFNLKSLRTEYNQKNIDYNNMSRNILQKNKYEEKLYTLSDEINNLNVISDLHQEKIIVFLNRYFENNNINANNISFTDATIIPVNINLESSQNKAKSTFENMMDEINKDASTQIDTQNLPQDTVTVKSITVSFAFESTYDNMISFIDDIQNHSYNILITNINLSTVDSDDVQQEEVLSFQTYELAGSITLNFYEVPKFDYYEETHEDWLWEDIKFDY